MSYIGSTPTTQSFIAGTDYFNGTGSQTAFTLSRSVVSVNDIEVVINNVVQQPNTAYTVSGTTITFTSAPSAGTANIYVRYLSTTTQSIAPSQGTVGWNQLTSDVKQDLGISFKNRIINGAMVLDQRNAGASITPTDGQYDVDRWCGRLTQASKFTLQQNAGSVTPPAGFRNYIGATSTSAYSVGSGDFFAIEQWIEGYNTADLMWGTANAQTVTLSFWARSSLTGTFGGSLRTYAGGYSYPFSYSIPTANTWVNISVTITGATAGTWNTTNSGSIGVAFSLGAGSSYSAAAGAWVASTTFQPTGSVSVVGTSGATFYITGVQLEVGTQATTFDYRSYGQELLLCQRYFEVYVSGGNNTGMMPMVTGSSTSGRGVYTQKVQKRANPSSVTFASPSSYLYQGAGLNSAPSAISVAVSSPGAVLVDVTISGATVNAAANLLENAAAGTNMILISAEL